MSATDDEVKQINDKLDAIKKTVDEEVPSKFIIWVERLKYVAIGLAWIIGALSHKWGLYQWIESHLP